METITKETFEDLPLVVEGHSKEVRYLGDGMVATRLKPTVYSYTHNRAGEIVGTDTARLRVSRALLSVVRPYVSHTYETVGDEFIVSRLVLPESTGELHQGFTPPDLTTEQIKQLPRATPIETVVKRYHTGTPKHRYFGMSGTTARRGNFRGSGQAIKIDEPYPELVVRFDWRNPLTDHDGNRLADEVLPETMANWYIDTEQAKLTGRLAFTALERSLKKAGLELWDICFFITEDGKTIFSEISPDCMRVRAADESLDKDVWRQGSSSDTVRERWNEFANIVENNL